MTCLYCNGQTRVVNSRLQRRTNSVWRRRQCQECQATVTTIEQVDTRTSLLIDKETGPEAFLRDKLLISVYESLRHRKTAYNDAQGLYNTIWSKVIAGASDGVIKRDQLIKVVILVLRRFDGASAVYYEAYHPLG